MNQQDRLLERKRVEETIPLADCAGVPYSPGEREDIIRYCLFVAEIQDTRTLRLAVEWGNEPCMEHFKHESKSQFRRLAAQGIAMKRRYCPQCWQVLRQEVGL